VDTKIKEKRMRWYFHVMRRRKENVTKSVLGMVVEEERRRMSFEEMNGLYKCKTFSNESISSGFTAARKQNL